MSFNKVLIERLKKEFKVKKDLDLAEIFNVSPFVFSSWKRSKGKLIEEIVKYGVTNDLNFNKIFHNKKSQNGRGVSILLADDLFSYYMNPKEKVTSLPKYNIPTLKEMQLGFQVISQNMEPLLTVSSLVFGVEVEKSECRSGEIYVLSILNKGIYITRFKGQLEGIYVFENDNKRFPDFTFNETDILTVFRVGSILLNNI